MFSIRIIRYLSSKTHLSQILIIFTLSLNTGVVVAAQKHDVTQKSDSHLISFFQDSSVIGPGNTGGETDSTVNKLTYIYSFTPIVFNSKPIDEAGFLQRPMSITIQYEKSYVDNVGFDSTSKIISYLFRDKDVPFTVGLMYSKSKAQTNNALYQSNTDSNTRELSLGYYLRPVTLISIKYTTYNNSGFFVSSAVSYNGSSSGKAKGFNIQDYEQLSSTQALVFKGSYSQQEIDSELTLTTKVLSFIYYPSRRTGLIFGYEIAYTNSPTDTPAKATILGINYYWSNAVALNLQYTKGDEGDPSFGSYKDTYAGFKILF